MPLVMGQPDPNNKTEEWTNKLAGKTIHDEPSTETVSISTPCSRGLLANGCH